MKWHSSIFAELLPAFSKKGTKMHLLSAMSSRNVSNNLPQKLTNSRLSGQMVAKVLTPAEASQIFSSQSHNNEFVVSVSVPDAKRSWTSRRVW